MEVGLVQRINIDEEMQQAYLDYAMSVIVARALPDARDGLKPVHRRILYAMFDMGLRPDTPYKKSARIVGEVLGKYHPHGDEAVYDSMARLAQDFSMRYRMVDGQGNFGSIDGDAPAAMRYTEARLATQALQMLGDINKNTVNFSPNFDGTLTEPAVLPAAIPNLLVNGATGIAVGMATSIPPHNLGEVVDAIHYMLEHWDQQDDVTVEDLMKFVQGPDFPTGGLIIQEAGGDGLVSAYSTGRGRVTMQASAHLEEMERGRNRIIVNELPYMTNKSALIERIASLVREEKLEGVADLRDESDRQGMRIVIELSKTAIPDEVLSSLYKNTPMQSTFSIIMLALVDGEPRLLSLKQCVRVFIEHRIEIVRRRSEFDLERARQRAHILEGLRIALANLDEVIAIIRKAPDAEIARERLIKRFKLSIIQAQAILDMPLRRLAALERKKIEDEYKEVQALIKELEGLLRSPKKMRQVVDQELQAIKETFGDRRRTHIVQLKTGETKVSLLTASELKPEKLVWVCVTADGMISRTLDDKMPRLGGKDSPHWLIQANTRETLYLVCHDGEAAAVAVHAIPEAGEPANGLPLHKVSALREGMVLADLFTLPPKDRRAEAAQEIKVKQESERYILTATSQGMIKKSSISDLPGPSASSFTLARVNDGDKLGWLGLSNGKSDILLATSTGMSIRFNEDEVRPMGLVAAGVMGIKLQADDRVVGMELLPQPGDVCLIASDGSAKRVPVDQFPRQGRYGQGIIAWKVSPKVALVGMVVGKGTRRIVLQQSRLAPHVIRLDEATLASRAARGHPIDAFKPGDQITGITIPRGIEADPLAKSHTGGGSPSSRKKPIDTPSTVTKTSPDRVKSSLAKKTTSAPSIKTTASSSSKTAGEKSIQSSAKPPASTPQTSRSSGSKATSAARSTPKTSTSKDAATKASPPKASRPATAAMTADQNVQKSPAKSSTTSRGSKSQTGSGQPTQRGSKTKAQTGSQQKKSSPPGEPVAGGKTPNTSSKKTTPG